MRCSWIVSVLLIPFQAHATKILTGSQQQSLLQQQANHENDKLSDIIAASRFLSFHRKLVEIQSISDHELQVGNYLANLLEQHGYLVTRQLVSKPSTKDDEQQWNIYATPDPSKFPSRKISSGKRANPKVLLTSHIDTVPPFIPYSLSIPQNEGGTFKREDILVSGRGTVDAKACVAAQVTAAMRILRDPDFQGDPSDLALLYVVDEETGGDGMLHFSDSKLYADTKEDLKAIIFGEPTEGKLASGHKGITSLTIDAHGKAAHSGYPWLGRSAVSMILPALTILETLGDLSEGKGGLPRSDLFGNATVNIGYIEAGVAMNVVPEHALAKVAFRLAAGTVEHNIDVIKKAIHSVDRNDLLNLTFHGGYGPVHLDTDVPGFEDLSVNYGTDIPNLKTDEGVKRYLYGPGSIHVAHGAKEGLTVGELERAVQDYERLIKHALSL